MKKLTKALVKKAIELSDELMQLGCQRYNQPGKCADFSGAMQHTLCPACEIRTAAHIMQLAAKKYNPERAVF